MGLRRLDNLVRAAVGAGLALVVAASIGAPASAQGDARAERDEVRRQQDRLAEQLDVLQASDADIDAALDQIDGAIAAQEASLEEALTAADAAAAAVRQGEADLRAAHRDVEILEQAIVEMAVASYVHPPTADLVQSLQAQTLSDALKQRIYLDARAQRDLDLLDLLEGAEQHAAEVATELAAASEAADRAVEAADAELVRLEDERQHQAAFAADLQVRIDGALAEAAALADLDAELSEQIVAEQAALIARLPPAPAPAVQEAPAAPAPTPAAPPAPSAPVEEAPTTTAPPEPTDEPSTTTTTRPSTTTTTRPPVTVRYDPPPVPPLETVRGFTVHAEIAGDVAAMLDAAAADGITFGGSAYRSTDRQIQLRIANCGPTEYDIWYRPASTCSPPTAVPGRSLHEQGRALDLTFEGRLITTRANRGFQWLAANAASYGLFNLPSEPWHWSTTGG
ncbi:MAG TPA: M15 family metallopeptidase [Acidimicrobiales bacterium]|nr:M15 family metallopeptidase [Acidimicrobiales bacterium]